MNRKAKRFTFGGILLLGLVAAWLYMLEFYAPNKPQPWHKDANYKTITWPDSLQNMHYEL